MSANRQQSDPDLQKPYSSLDADDLEQLMEYAFYEETESIDTLSEILEAYKEKKGLKTEDSAKAWSDFQRYYSGQEETFPFVQDENVDNPKQIKSITDSVRLRRYTSIKRLGIVAAAFVVFSTLFLSSTALGGSFWQSIAQWGRETFGFSERVITVQINEELISLHEALEEHGITTPLAPTWIPDGFELIDLYVDELPEKMIFMAQFENGVGVLLIQILALKNQIGNVYERNDEEISVFSRSGIDHYIMSNMEMVNVVWRNQNYECLISGDITIGDAQKMINSVYER